MAKKRYTGRVHVGHGKYEWVGRFDTRRERDDAVAEARVKIKRRHDPDKMTVEDWCERFLRRYEGSRKTSSYITAKTALKVFRQDFGNRPLRSVSRIEAIDWAQKSPAYRIAVVVTLFNEAVDAELIDRNPFRGTEKRSEGRSAERPPTEQEFAQLLRACSVLGWYAPQMRALATFAAYTGMRPGELFMLRWRDIDFDTNRIYVTERLYRGAVDTPKSGAPKLIALTPPARDAIAGLPREKEWVFLTMRRKRFQQSTNSEYWRRVNKEAGLDFDFYLSTKHFCVHYLWVQCNLSPRAIAQQMGWKLSSVDELLKVYGHGEIGALEEVDRAFHPNVVKLRDVTEEMG